MHVESQTRKRSEAYSLENPTPVRVTIEQMIIQVQEVLNVLQFEQSRNEDKSIHLDENKVEVLRQLMESYGTSIMALDTAFHKSLGMPKEFLIFASPEELEDYHPQSAIPPKSSHLRLRDRQIREQRQLRRNLRRGKIKQ